MIQKNLVGILGITLLIITWNVYTINLIYFWLISSLLQNNLQLITYNNLWQVYIFFNNIFLITLNPERKEKISGFMNRIFNSIAICTYVVYLIHFIYSWYFKIGFKFFRQTRKENSPRNLKNGLFPCNDKKKKIFTNVFIFKFLKKIVLQILVSKVRIVLLKKM